MCMPSNNVISSIAPITDAIGVESFQNPVEGFPRRVKVKVKGMRNSTLILYASEISALSHDALWNNQGRLFVEIDS